MNAGRLRSVCFYCFRSSDNNTRANVDVAIFSLLPLPLAQLLLQVGLFCDDDRVLYVYLGENMRIGVSRVLVLLPLLWTWFRKITSRN